MSENAARVVLKPGRERSVARRHPWLFSGAIGRVEGAPGPGETVAVHSAGGELLGRGAWSAASQLRVRLWTFGEEPVDAAFFRARIAQAVAGRTLGEGQARRLVNAESDGLPGLVVDYYDGFAVCQFLSAGAERRRAEVVQALQQILSPRGLYERSDAEVRLKEGLKPRKGLLAGEAPPAFIAIDEEGCRYLVDVVGGHKTGFYLDQRLNRRLVRSLAAGAETLNCFAYTGGFGLAAAVGGAASTRNLEASGAALAVATQNAALNGVEDRFEAVQGDVFRLLRQYRDEQRRFDLVVLDPPKFAETTAAVEGACRGYKDVNMLGMQLLRPGGLLVTFSCSGRVGADLFQKVVSDAALDAEREAQVLHRLGQADDHPVRIHFPEGWYLKGLVCRIA